MVINHLRHSIRIRTKPAHIKPTRNSQPLPIRGTKQQYSRTVQPQPIVQPSVPDSTMIAHSTIAAPTPHQALTDSMTSQTSKQDRAATLLSAAEETAFAKTRPARPIISLPATYGIVQSQHSPYQTPLWLSSCRTLNPVVPNTRSLSCRQLMGHAARMPQPQSSRIQQHQR